MADGCFVCMLCYFCCCTVLPCTVLQGLGLLTPFWIVDDNCDTGGLFYRCCAVNGTYGCAPVTEHVKATLGLESTAFAFFLVCTFCSLIMIFASDSSSCDVCLGISVCLFSLLYVLAGMFSLIGCILIGVDNPATSLGVSFYLCLVAGCYTLVQVVIVCSITCYYCCKSDDKPDSYRTDVGLENPAGPGQTDTGGGTAATTQDSDTGFSINFRAAQFVIPKVLQTVKDRFSKDA